MIVSEIIFIWSLFFSVLFFLLADVVRQRAAEVDLSSTEVFSLLLKVS